MTEDRERAEQLLAKYGVECGVSIQQHGDRLVYGPEFIKALLEFAEDARCEERKRTLKEIADLYQNALEHGMEGIRRFAPNLRLMLTALERGDPHVQDQD